MLEDIVFKEISNYLNLSVNDFSTDTSLDNLGIDSIGAITILYELEDKLDIEVPNEIFKSLHTIGDIVLQLEQLMKKDDA